MGEEPKARQIPCRYIEHIVISVCGLDDDRKLVDNVLEGTDNPDKNRHWNGRHILISMLSRSTEESPY